MAKNSYYVYAIDAKTPMFEATSFPSCQTFARNYLTEPQNFGKRLQVYKNRSLVSGAPGEKVFDVTSIKYSSGKVRMTLYSEFLKQQAKLKAKADIK